MKRFNLAPDIDRDIKVLLPDGSSRPLATFLLPVAAMMLSALLLMTSLFAPYWRFKLTAPQYPKGLSVQVYVNRLVGDVKEIDGLNHYLGMPPLDEGGRFERTISFVAIVAMALLLSAGVFVHNRWAALLALPALLYPAIFVADLYYILYQYGHSIDPKSALGGAIDPFTPPILGAGKIGQFGSFAQFDVGFYLAIAASVVLLAALWLHRAAYKPVLDARKRVARLAAGDLMVSRLNS
jgi:hypothetical protein